MTYAASAFYHFFFDRQNSRSRHLTLLIMYAAGGQKTWKAIPTKLNDIFEVRFGDVHYSKQQITEIIPGKKLYGLLPTAGSIFLKTKPSGQI